MAYMMASGNVKLGGRRYFIDPAADQDAIEYGALHFHTLIPSARAHLIYEVAIAYDISERTAFQIIRSIRNALIDFNKRMAAHG